MAQTTRQPSMPVEEADRSDEDMAHAVTTRIGPAAEAAQAGAERLAEATRELADQAAPMLRLVLDRTGPAMQQVVRAESELAGVWLGAVREQAQLNLDTMRRLAAARDWPTAFRVQSEFARQSLTLVQEGVLAHLKLTGAIATSLAGMAGAEQRQAA